MRELRARAGAAVDVPPQACLALLADVASYPRWCPDAVRGVEVVEPDRARLTLRLGVGPLAGSFDELMVVRVDAPSRVALARVPHEPTDPERLEVTWTIRPGPPTRLEVELSAALEVPRLVPLGGIANSLAQDLVAAATRALSPPSPMTSAKSS